ncbi:MAG: tetratricopeptide repeat protein, partial [Actinomycetota bacterium]
MPKSRSKAHRAAPKPAARATDPRSRGLTAFRQGKFDLAISEWSALEPESHPELASALAEALLRRAHSPYQSPDLMVRDLRHAVRLAPEDARLQYHLGLAEHRAGNLSAAADAYARAAALGLDRRGPGYARGLAELEQNPGINLEAFAWLGPHDLAALTPVQTLLRQEPDECLRALSEQQRDLTNPDPMTPLWTGLAHLMKRDAEGAAAVLGQSGARLPKGAGEVQRFYLGLACASIGDLESAERHWTEVTRATQKVGVEPLAQLSDALTWLQGLKLTEITGPSRWKAALDEALANERTAGEAQFRVALVAANRLADSAVKSGDWRAASTYWAKMRQILAGRPELGPAAPILQNLALACERLEEWEPAADAWSALLDATPRARGRKKDAAQEAAREAKRAWIRNRALSHLRTVGRADKAIEHFRQAIKAEPENLELRLDMASALLANEQWVAARNEI